MRRLFSSSFCTRCLVALGLSLGLTNASLAVDVDITESTVIWQMPSAAATTLTLSGPRGIVHYSFGAGEHPLLGLSDKAGAPLEDGSYTWQLTSQPEIDKTTRQAMHQSRLEGKVYPLGGSMGTTQSGTFSISGGSFVLPTEEIEAPAQTADPNKDQVISDDLIVDGSLCVGLSCANFESFGNDTLRLKENLLRLRFLDDSNSPFPRVDWQLVANDSTSGGAEKFSIEEIDGGNTPFTIRAGAPSDSLYVASTGKIGLGTATPAMELHIVDGDSPTFRLNQDGSNGFGAQTWDLVGNEASFFVRDVTNSSKLPFRIRSGAPTSAIDIQSTGKVGINTSSPTSTVHVKRSDGSASFKVEDTTDTAGTYTLMELVTSNSGGSNVRPRFTMTHGGVPATWNFDILNNGSFTFTRGGGGAIFAFGSNGNLSIEGNFISDGTTLEVPDFVFAEDYNLMPLDQLDSFIRSEGHLPEVPSAGTVQDEGLNITEMQLKLLQKVEELTLYTLDQHSTIRDQQETILGQQSAIDTQQKTIDELLHRLEALESTP